MAQVVKIDLGGNGEIIERTVVPGQYDDGARALAFIEAEITKYPSNGYDEERGYWWARDATGEIHRFAIFENGQPQQGYGTGRYGHPHAPQPPDTSSFEVAAKIAADQRNRLTAAVQSTSGETTPVAAPPDLATVVVSPDLTAGTAPQEVRMETGQDASVTMQITRPAIGYAQGSSAATAIGTALLQNREAIDLATAGLSILIADKIQALRQQRLNSPEGRAEIARYEDLQEKLDTLRESASKPLSVPTEEEEVVKSTTSFTEALGNWWTQRHVEAFDMGLFLTGVSICALLGASGVLIAAICGAIVGGKRVSDMIKAIAKGADKKKE